MKVKKYQVTLMNPEGVHIRTSFNYHDVVRIYCSLDNLWGDIDFEEWTLEIAPYWEEVPDNA